MRLDPRRVRQAFQGIDESARSYLLRRRLLEAARRLRDPRWRGNTIAEIAHCCGFASNERSIP
jgi:AraC-like DNA-binding protein